MQQGLLYAKPGSSPDKSPSEKHRKWEQSPQQSTGIGSTLVSTTKIKSKELECQWASWLLSQLYPTLYKYFSAVRCRDSESHSISVIMYHSP